MNERQSDNSFKKSCNWLMLLFTPSLICIILFASFEMGLIELLLGISPLVFLFHLDISHIIFVSLFIVWENGPTKHYNP